MDAELARKLFRYNPKTGELIWQWHPTQAYRLVGKNAGYTRKAANGKHIHVMFMGKSYPAHRIIWLMIYDEWPDQIDHINGEQDNNKRANIRDASQSENQRNQKVSINNTSGVIGVSYDKSGRRYKRWLVSINYGGRQRKLGRFADWFDAVCARKSAEHKHGYHVNHGRVV